MSLDDALDPTVEVDPDGADVPFAAWLVTLLPRMGTVARCYLPGAPIDPRRRELVLTVATGAAGQAELARIHAGWHDLLGPAELSEVDDEVLAWVVEAVSGPTRLDGDGLPDEVPAELRRAVVALVGHSVVSAATAQRVTSLAQRLAGQRPRRLLGAAGDLVAGAAGLPFVLPTAVAGLALGVVGRLVPDPPEVEVDGEPNLLAQLLAETLPTWLGSAWGRTLVARLPWEVPVAVRSGLAGATVRVGRGVVKVRNGIEDDAWALFDGEIDALLRAGSHTLTRELRSDRLQR